MSMLSKLTGIHINKGNLAGILSGNPFAVASAFGNPGGGGGARAPQPYPFPTGGPGGSIGIQVGGPTGVSVGYTGHGGGSSAACGPNGACPRGYHLNKGPLAPTKKHGALPARSICVRNRRMNPLDGHAARRALRRIKAASKMVRKLHMFSGTRSVAARSGGHKSGCGCVTCKRR